MLSREAVVNKGGNPVWYTNMSPDSVRTWLVREVNELIAIGVRQPVRLVGDQFVSVDLADLPIAKIAPFYRLGGAGSKGLQLGARVEGS